MALATGTICQETHVILEKRDFIKQWSDFESNFGCFPLSSLNLNYCMSKEII